MAPGKPDGGLGSFVFHLLVADEMADDAVAVDVDDDDDDGDVVDCDSL